MVGLTVSVATGVSLLVGLAVLGATGVSLLAGLTVFGAAGFSPLVGLAGNRITICGFWVSVAGSGGGPPEQSPSRCNVVDRTRMRP